MLKNTTSSKPAPIHILYKTTAIPKQKQKQKRKLQLVALRRNQPLDTSPHKKAPTQQQERKAWGAPQQAKRAFKQEADVPVVQEKKASPLSQLPAHLGTTVELFLCRIQRLSLFNREDTLFEIFRDLQQFEREHLQHTRAVQFQDDPTSECIGSMLVDALIKAIDRLIGDSMMQGIYQSTLEKTVVALLSGQNKEKGRLVNRCSFKLSQDSAIRDDQAGVTQFYKCGTEALFQNPNPRSLAIALECRQQAFRGSPPQLSSSNIDKLTRAIQDTRVDKDVAKTVLLAKNQVPFELFQDLVRGMMSQINRDHYYLGEKGHEKVIMVLECLRAVKQSKEEYDELVFKLLNELTREELSKVRNQSIIRSLAVMIESLNVGRYTYDDLLERSMEPVMSIVNKILERRSLSRETSKELNARIFRMVQEVNINSLGPYAGRVFHMCGIDPLEEALLEGDHTDEKGARAMIRVFIQDQREKMIQYEQTVKSGRNQKVTMESRVPKLAVYALGRGVDRASDAELILLQTVVKTAAKHHLDFQSTQGTIQLDVDKEMCFSCILAMVQFRTLFPNVTIQVRTGND